MILIMIKIIVVVIMIILLINNNSDFDPYYLNCYFLKFFCMIEFFFNFII